jgi:hypothetical protein
MLLPDPGGCLPPVGWPGVWVPPFAQFAAESGRGTVHWGLQLARPELSKQGYWRGMSLILIGEERVAG